MGKLGALAAAGVMSAIAIALTACGSSVTPEQLRTQATVLAAQSNGAAREARSLDAQATEQAQAAAAYRATQAALLVTPSATPAPTLTPLPTVTLTPAPSVTPAPSATIAPAVVIVVTPEPPKAEPTANAPAPRERNIYDDWPIVVALAVAALAAVIVLWRLIDGKTVILPGRGDNNGH